MLMCNFSNIKLFFLEEQFLMCFFSFFIQGKLHELIDFRTHSFDGNSLK